MIKIKKDVNPIGTRHHVPTFIPGAGLTRPIYQVYDIAGTENHAPTGKKMVFLKYDDSKPAHPFPMTLCVTLDFLASDYEAVTAEDVFWVVGKGSKIETSEV